MTKLGIFIIALVFPKTLFGQIPPIQLDRPDQTECSFIVPVGYLQMENGFTFETIGLGEKNFTFPSILTKYGVNEHFEIRLITELQSNIKNNIKKTGLSPITLGFKSNICKEKGWIPMISFIGHLSSSNIGTKVFHSTYLSPSFRFTAQHTLSEKVSLAYNLGTEWDGETANPTYIYSLSSAFSLSKQLGMYLEFYGFAPENNAAQHLFDGGFTFLVSQNFMLDLSASTRLTENAPKNYISFGVSYRFKVK